MDEDAGGYFFQVRKTGADAYSSCVHVPLPFFINFHVLRMFHFMAETHLHCLHRLIFSKIHDF